MTRSCLHLLCSKIAQVAKPELRHHHYLEAARWWRRGTRRSTRSGPLWGRVERSCTHGTRSGSACLQKSDQGCQSVAAESFICQFDPTLATVLSESYRPTRISNLLYRRVVEMRSISTGGVGITKKSSNSERTQILLLQHTPTLWSQVDFSRKATRRDPGASPLRQPRHQIDGAARNNIGFDAHLKNRAARNPFKNRFGEWRGRTPFAGEEGGATDLAAHGTSRRFSRRGKWRRKTYWRADSGGCGLDLFGRRTRGWRRRRRPRCVALTLLFFSFPFVTCYKSRGRPCQWTTDFFFFLFFPLPSFFSNRRIQPSVLLWNH